MTQKLQINTMFISHYKIKEVGLKGKVSKRLYYCVMLVAHGLQKVKAIYAEVIRK